MTIGAARPALDIATHYTSRRKAFGQIINRFQGVSFQVAEAARRPGERDRLGQRTE
jgi:butyryl-CoA dehydrogenase